MLEISLEDAVIQMTARRALEELESIRMVESEIDNHLLHGPTEGSETARAILESLGIPIPKATLTALPGTSLQSPKTFCSVETTLF